MHASSVSRVIPPSSLAAFCGVRIWQSCTCATHAVTTDSLCRYIAAPASHADANIQHNVDSEWRSRVSTVAHAMSAHLGHCAWRTLLRLNAGDTARDTAPHSLDQIAAVIIDRVDDDKIFIDRQSAADEPVQSLRYEESARSVIAGLHAPSASRYPSAPSSLQPGRGLSECNKSLSGRGRGLSNVTSQRQRRNHLGRPAQSYGLPHWSCGYHAAPVGRALLGPPGGTGWRKAGSWQNQGIFSS